MKNILVIVFLMLVAQLHAQVRIGAMEARATAERFLLQQGKQDKQALTLSEAIQSEASGLTNLFVFSLEPQGFVVVSALGEVLAYSFHSSFPASDELPEHIAYWLDLYNRQTDYLVEHPELKREPSKSPTSVGPLLTSIWGQGCYHNEACPADANGPCGHVSAGCVAIAMAQIMYYHKYPQQGNGTITYSCSPYGTLSANFGETVYQWEDMADTLHDYNSAVSQLISHCGIGVKMKYGAHLSLASNPDALNAFLQFFSYPSSALSSRSSYSDENWITMIREDLDERHPIYYTGTSNLGGHAFVCDGYDSNGLFHFNFGWDGVADGYYTLDDPSGFSTGQSVIHYIYPIDEITISSDSHGIIYVAPDGTGNGSSWAEATGNLQMALIKSHLGDYSIWVKEGLYKCNTMDDYAFRLYHNSKLYGGFKGDEPYYYDLSQRDFEAHPSILDGDHKQGVVDALPHFNSESIIIDGFTIRNGISTMGGGIIMTNNTLVSNCKICYNSAEYGGALTQYAVATPSGIVVQDCEIFGNEARYGGAISDRGNVTYMRCHIHDNIAQLNGGGIICHVSNKQTRFINCIISNNVAYNCGGGIANKTSSTSVFWSCLVSNNTANKGGGCYLMGDTGLFNCTIVKNEALEDYGGVYCMPSLENRIKNCIIWGNVSAGEYSQIEPNTKYSHCAVQDELSGTNYNFNVMDENDGSEARFYVRFKNPTAVAGSTGQGGDYRLKPDSYCIDKVGNIPNQPATDLEGNPRLRHSNVDIGAYESNTLATFINAYYCEDEPFYYQDSLISELDGLYSFLHPGELYDSLTIIHLQTPPPTVFLVKEICENETYDFLGTPISEPGQYFSTDRCVTYLLNLTVEPLDTITLKKEICEGDTYDFFGFPLEETGSYSTKVNCNIYQLDLEVKPNTISVLEEEICEGDIYDFFGTMLNDEGYYYATINCTTYHLDLKVKSHPALHCTHDTIVEYGNLVELTASGANAYLWSTGDTTASITVYPMIDHTYTVTGFFENGCSEEASFIMWVTDAIEETVLYPNPADGKVTIYMPRIDEIEVFNMHGLLMDHVIADKKFVELDVSHYVSGVYVIHVRQMKNHHYLKLVIRH